MSHSTYPTAQDWNRTIQLPSIQELQLRAPPPGSLPVYWTTSNRPMAPPPLRLHVPNLHSETSHVAPFSRLGQPRSEVGNLDQEEAYNRQGDGVDGDNGKEGYNTDANDTDGEVAPCRPKQKRRRDPQNCEGQ